VLEECYALKDEESMRRVMAEPRKLQGPITGVVKNGGKSPSSAGVRHVAKARNQLTGYPRPIWPSQCAPNRGGTDSAHLA
jgi:hypothetical protein